MSQSYFINRLATTGCISTKRLSFNPSWNITRGESFKILDCLMNQKQSINKGAPSEVEEHSPTYSPNIYTEPSFLWFTTSYGACSSNCGEGIQERTVSCKNATDNQVVDDWYCQSTGITKPVARKICNLRSCNNTPIPSPTPILPTITLSAYPKTITAGTTSTLNWSSSNTISCRRNTADGKWEIIAPTGSITTLPLSQTSTFVVECENASGTGSASVTVVVQQNVNEADPGPNTFWNPPGSTTYVVDQMAWDATGVKYEFLPGCSHLTIAESPRNSSDGCASKSYFIRTLHGTNISKRFSFAVGSILSVRFRGNPA